MALEIVQNLDFKSSTPRLRGVRSPRTSTLLGERCQHQTQNSSRKKYWINFRPPGHYRCEAWGITQKLVLHLFVLGNERRAMHLPMKVFESLFDTEYGYHRMVFIGYQIIRMALNARLTKSSPHWTTPNSQLRLSISDQHTLLINRFESETINYLSDESQT